MKWTITIRSFFLAFLRTTTSVVHAFFLHHQRYHPSSPSLRRVKRSVLYFKRSGSSSSRQDLIKQVALAKHTFLSVAAALSSLPPEVFTTPPMIEPDRNLSEEHLKLSLDLIQNGWSDLDGFQLSEMESDQLDQSQASTPRGDGPASPSTYGEITEVGARQLFHCFERYSNSGTYPMNFVDLGSGVGKLVVQAYMELPHLQKSTGIELSPSRHASAIQTWATIQNEADQIRNIETKALKDASVELVEGDMFDYDMKDVTHIYVASLCFSEAMMHRLAHKLKQEATQLQCIATLKEFPKWFHKEFGKPRVEYIEMTWTRPQGARVFIYHQTRR